MGHKCEDMVGKVFGRLTVISRTESVRYGIYKKRAWICKCECGNETKQTTGHLNSGNVKSCGCLHAETSAENGRNSRHLIEKKDAVFNVLYGTYKRNARKRNIEFCLTKDEMMVLVSKNCAYCGEEPSNYYKYYVNKTTTYYSGIDRIDNEKGYVYENCVPCCKFCNHAKKNHSKDTFLKRIAKIYEYNLKLKNEHT